MLKSFAVLVLCAIAGHAFAQPPAASGEPRAIPAPSLPYVDSHACPFEGCSYRDWTARKTLLVYDTWRDGRRATGKLSAGEKVLALDGVVITHRPGVIRMDRDLPGQALKRGDTVLTYTYQGEFVSSVWVRGKFYPEMDLSFARGPDGSGCRTRCSGTFTDPGKHSWWARIKTKSDLTGWVLATGNFDGQDLLSGQ